MDKTEKGIIRYSSVLIALMLNSGKLLAFKATGFLARYWTFDLSEYLIQLSLSGLYCYFIFNINLKKSSVPSRLRVQRHYLGYIAINITFFLGGCLLAGIIQYRLYMSNHHLRGVFWAGAIARFFLASLFTGIIIKIVLLIRESKQKHTEHEHLKSAYLQAELELLKEQINPHFLFNSLSSLQGMIGENASLAQHYVGHLSKVFRYALVKAGTTLVTVKEELVMIQSYQELLKMRFEKAFVLDIAVADKYRSKKVPHLSLQPLLENAAKHNTATIQTPLKVRITAVDDFLIVSNNLQPMHAPQPGTGVGLNNLNERYCILMQQEIEVLKTAESFIVKLPLKN